MPKTAKRKVAMNTKNTKGKAKGRSAATKKAPTRKAAQPKKPAAASAGKNGIVIGAKGLVVVAKSRDGVAFAVYTTSKDAIEGGVDKALAAAVFRAGNCTGVCETRKQFDPNTGRLTKVWCVDISCSRGGGGCSCHLFKLTRKQDGSIEEEDLGGYDKENPFFPPAGRAVYVCRCV